MFIELRLTMAAEAKMKQLSER